MKRVISYVLTSAILIAILCISASAVYDEHWAQPSIHYCLKEGYISAEAASGDPDEEITGSVFSEMLLEAARNKEIRFPAHDMEKNLTRYDAIEILSRYLSETYFYDEFLQGRQKYMTIEEQYRIAKYQNIDLAHVLDFTVVYSCGLFSSGQCQGARELTLGEACTILTRLNSYEDLQESPPELLDRFYTMHCTCRLSGEHA